MIRYLSILISLINPLNYIIPHTAVESYISKPSVTCMSPPPMGKGHGISISKAARVTNAINDIGCSSTTTTTQKEDGTVIRRETLTCTKEIIEKPSGEVKQKPAATSSKLQGRIVQEFFKDSSRNTPKNKK